MNELKKIKIQFKQIRIWWELFFNPLLIKWNQQTVNSDWYCLDHFHNYLLKGMNLTSLSLSLHSHNGRLKKKKEWWTSTRTIHSPYHFTNQDSSSKNGCYIPCQPWQMKTRIYLCITLQKLTLYKTLNR